MHRVRSRGLSCGGSVTACLDWARHQTGRHEEDAKTLRSKVSELEKDNERLRKRLRHADAQREDERVAHRVCCRLARRDQRDLEDEVDDERAARKDAEKSLVTLAVKNDKMAQRLRQAKEFAERQAEELKATKASEQSARQELEQVRAQHLSTLREAEQYRAQLNALEVRMANLVPRSPQSDAHMSV